MRFYSVCITVEMVYALRTESAGEGGLTRRIANDYRELPHQYQPLLEHEMVVVWSHSRGSAGSESDGAELVLLLQQG
jgi:hypothetical protein